MEGKKVISYATNEAKLTLKIYEVVVIPNKNDTKLVFI